MAVSRLEGAFFVLFVFLVVEGFAEIAYLGGDVEEWVVYPKSYNEMSCEYLVPNSMTAYGGVGCSAPVPYTNTMTMGSTSMGMRICCKCKIGYHIMTKMGSYNQLVPSSCESCSKCPSGSVNQGCKGVSPGSCVSCSVCSPSQYQSGLCEAGSVGGCEQCADKAKECASKNQLLVGCGDGRPGFCMPCAVANEQQYVATPCNMTHDSKVVDCSVRAAECLQQGKLLSKCGWGNPGECVGCRACSPQQFSFRACTLTMDTDCRDCTLLASSCFLGVEYLSGCGGGNNGTCTKCRQCGDNEREVSPCMPMKDRECSACTVCDASQYLVSKCDKFDTVCKSCSDLEKVCDGVLTGCGHGARGNCTGNATQVEKVAQVRFIIIMASEVTEEQKMMIKKIVAEEYKIPVEWISLSVITVPTGRRLLSNNMYTMTADVYMDSATAKNSQDLLSSSGTDSIMNSLQARVAQEAGVQTEVQVDQQQNSLSSGGGSTLPIWSYPLIGFFAVVVFFFLFLWTRKLKGKDSVGRQVSSQGAGMRGGYFFI